MLSPDARAGAAAAMRTWAIVFASLTALLCVAVAVVVRENRRLRAQVTALVREQARIAGLEEGDQLDAFTLLDAKGSELVLGFGDGHVGTLLLVHAAGCDACRATADHWRAAIEGAARPDVRVLCIQTDAGDAPPLVLAGLPPSLAVPLPPQGWLARIPAVPATLVVDEHGRLTRAWYRQLDAGTTVELTEALTRLGFD